MNNPTQPISLNEFKKQHKTVRAIHHERVAKPSRLDRFALFITRRVGTIGFFLIIACWTFLWIGWNLLTPPAYQFDPPMGFVFWLFISNMIQILLMPLIMVGQNIQGRAADRRAENDLAINVQAEEEIELILQHLEYQNSILIAMVEKLGCEVRELKGE